MLSRRSRKPTTIIGTAFGAELLLRPDSEETASFFRECLPPTWTEGGELAAPMELELVTVGRGAYEVRRDGLVAVSGARDEVLESLGWIIRGHIATNAPQHIFIHAGTVAAHGRAIVIPGESFSGKTTLVSELVLAGAEYYSDEYAVIDQAGLVHPYPKPLSIRTRDLMALRVNTPAAELGGATGTEPIPVGLVVATQYRPRAHWAPAELTPAETVLTLMSHTYSALERPEQTLRLLRLAVERGSGLQGDRGDASVVVPDLLDRLDSQRPPLDDRSSA